MFWSSFVYSPFIAFAIYLFAAVTDALDGNYARKTKTVSNAGKFLDPISDKIFVHGVMIALIFIGIFSRINQAVTYVNAACIIIMLTREFAIAVIRQMAAERSIVIGADSYGKTKTVLTFISFGAFILSLFDNGNETIKTIANVIYYFGLAVFYAATVFSVLSGVNYYLKNKANLKFE
jgi:CDP-diacylglycerol--glycerol-3-phosphate 3-phosphatidyltransferase